MSYSGYSYRVYCVIFSCQKPHSQNTLITFNEIKRVIVHMPRCHIYSTVHTIINHRIVPRGCCFGHAAFGSSRPTKRGEDRNNVGCYSCLGVYSVLDYRTYGNHSACFFSNVGTGIRLHLRFLNPTTMCCFSHRCRYKAQRLQWWYGPGTLRKTNVALFVH